MQTLPSQFISFAEPVNQINLPDNFTFPFCYQPHQLTQLAANQLQQLIEQNLAKHLKEQGRMFGVLVVKTTDNQIGFLAAVSGSQLELPQQNPVINNLVPAMFSGIENIPSFAKKAVYIQKLTEEITQLKTSLALTVAKYTLSSEKDCADWQVGHQQLINQRQKKLRKLARTELSKAFHNQQVSKAEYDQKSIQLAKQSVDNKNKLKMLKEYWQARIAKAEVSYSQLSDELNQLKKQRAKSSKYLQKQIFQQYQLLNKELEQLDILQIFTKYSDNTPPAGTGDCAAPKLLQYAFEHQLTPVCMGEFWWGKPPKSEVRKQGQFYPSCSGKCKPLLAHMLKGISMDKNPILENPAENLSLEIVYQDEDIIVINKPSGLLSVPGKHITDSVYTRIQQKFHENQVTIVHRLDMSTSGLMVLSLNTRAHKSLQKQFNAKQVSKQYIANVNGLVESNGGMIKLPLRGDIDDRPRQLVCLQHGKYAETHWQVIKREKKTTRLQLIPITGRTHQLRVHCAHPDGLNLAIVGDDLYGTTANRLHLHAQQLKFEHPINKKPLSFFVEPDF